MSMQPPFIAHLPIPYAALLPALMILLLTAGGATRSRWAATARWFCGSAAAAAGVVALVAAFPAGFWFPHRPFLLPAALCMLCTVLGIRARLRRPVGVAARPGRGDAMQDARMARRLAGLVETPSRIAVSRIAHRLALRAGADATEADELQAAALLYDVGRAGLPAAQAVRSGPPDADGQRRLCRMPAIGARILGDGRSGLLDRAAEIALCHRECWDGSGYPRGLSGLQIPFAARVVAAAAAFEAVLAGHDDAEPRPPGRLLQDLDREAGRLLDPRLARILLDDLPGMMQLHDQARRTAAAAGRGGPVPDAALAPSSASGVVDVAGAADIGRRAGPGYA